MADINSQLTEEQRDAIKDALALAHQASVKLTAAQTKLLQVASASDYSPAVDAAKRLADEARTVVEMTQQLGRRVGNEFM